MYSPGYSTTVPPMVSVFTKDVGWYSEDVGSAWPSSGAWESANRAVYHPLILAAPCVVRRLWWANGSTVSASYNVDCGVYADSSWAPGAKLVSTGSTAQGTASQVQFVDVTDTTLCPGLYWLALSVSSTSATIGRASFNGSAYDATLRYQEDSAVPLPATATPAESSSAYAYLFGFATTASP